MENIRWPDGWSDYQRCAGHAPSGRVCVWAGSWGLERNLSLWQCLCAEGDTLSPAERKTGKKAADVFRADSCGYECPNYWAWRKSLKLQSFLLMIDSSQTAKLNNIKSYKWLYLKILLWFFINISKRRKDVLSAVCISSWCVFECNSLNGISELQSNCCSLKRAIM